METGAHTNLSFNGILVFIIGFAFAVFVSSFVFISPLVSLLMLFIGAAILAGEKIHKKEVPKEILFISIILIAFSLGTLRYSIKDFHEPVVPTETGVVISEPEDKGNFRRFVYLSENNEKVLVSAPLYSPVQYGDAIVVSGKFERPAIIEDENGGRPFDYGRYLSIDDIYYVASFAEVEIVSSGHGNRLKSALFRLKRSLVSKAKEILSEPYSSLLMGLIVSGREALPKDILEEFRRAGVIHIVVLSGFNITLIAEFLRRMFQNLFIYARLPAIPQAAAGASIAGIVLFVLMTGAEATIVRAALMALIVIGAQLFGRNYSASRALIGAGFLMLLENPKILVFDPSFQLSFLATLGLIYVMPVAERKLNWVTERWQLKETLAQTLSTQLAVLPLLIYISGDVSLVSLPANILILLIVPYTMLIGFLATIAAYVSSILAWPLAYVSYLLLSWILFVSHTLGSLSFATINISSTFVWVIILAYAVFAAFMKFSSTFRQFKFSKKSST